MSERERWIVYPLLFFALGAALRDKLLQRVDTKEIFCESLKIVDRQDPTRLLAELGSGKEIPFDPNQDARRLGVLTLLDDEGQKVCQLARDLTASRVITDWLLVVDPVNQQPHIIAGTEQMPSMSFTGMDGPVTYRSVFLLDNRRLSVQPRVRRPQPKAPAPEVNAQ